MELRTKRVTAVSKTTPLSKMLQQFERMLIFKPTLWYTVTNTEFSDYLRMQIAAANSSTSSAAWRTFNRNIIIFLQK